jgi:hypothetical protein
MKTAVTPSNIKGMAIASGVVFQGKVASKASVTIKATRARNSPVTNITRYIDKPC